MVITTTPLRERMRQALRIRNVSPRTEYTYICPFRRSLPPLPGPPRAFPLSSICSSSAT